MSNNSLSVIKKSDVKTNIMLYRDSVTNQSKSIFKALSEGIPAYSINDFSLTEVLNVAITKIHLDLRQALPGDTDFAYMKESILKRIRTKKYNIRDKEILIAFENGVHEDYGKYYGLTAVSFSMFLAAYCSNDNTDRSEALRRLNVPQTQPKGPPSLSEQLDTSRENAINGYKLFLAGIRKIKDGDGERIIFGSSERFGSIIFDFFYKIKMFFITQEEIDDIMKRGSDLYFHELKSKAVLQKDALRRKEVENVIHNFLHKMQTDNQQPDQANPMVVAAAKRIYVDELFQGFSFEEMTPEGLAELINEKKEKYEAD